MEQGLDRHSAATVPIQGKLPFTRDRRTRRPARRPTFTTGRTRGQLSRCCWPTPQTTRSVAAGDTIAWLGNLWRPSCQCDCNAAVVSHKLQQTSGHTSRHCKLKSHIRLSSVGEDVHVGRGGLPAHLAGGKFGGTIHAAPTGVDGGRGASWLETIFFSEYLAEIHPMKAMRGI